MTLPLSHSNLCSPTSKSVDKITFENKTRSMSNEKKYDIFRDSLLRYLGYANEVGEAFRSLVPRFYVNGSYVVASSYVVADAFHKYQTTQEQVELIKQGEIVSNPPQFSPVISGVDALIWQSLASVIIPGFTINRLCAGSMFTLQKLSRKTSNSFKKWTVTAIGLLAIPFIIRPIDEGVHLFMDGTVRKIYKKTKEN